MHDYYILDDNHVPVAVDMMTWATSFDRRPHVGRDTVRGAMVSTVFLGLNHNWIPGGPPHIFETMVFGDPDYDQFQRRYSTWDEAKGGHALVLNHVLEPLWSRWICRLFAPLLGPLGEAIGGRTA